MIVDRRVVKVYEFVAFPIIFLRLGLVA